MDTKEHKESEGLDGGGIRRERGPNGGHGDEIKMRNNGLSGGGGRGGGGPGGGGEVSNDETETRGRAERGNCLI